MSKLKNFKVLEVGVCESDQKPSWIGGVHCEEDLEVSNFRKHAIVDVVSS